MNLKSCFESIEMPQISIFGRNVWLKDLGFLYLWEGWVKTILRWADIEENAERVNFITSQFESPVLPEGIAV